MPKFLLQRDMNMPFFGHRIIDYCPLKQAITWGISEKPLKSVILAPLGTGLTGPRMNHRSPRSRSRGIRVVLEKCNEIKTLPSCVWALVCQTRRNVQKSCTAWGILVLWTLRWSQRWRSLRGASWIGLCGGVCGGVNGGLESAEATAKRSTHGTISALISKSRVLKANCRVQSELLEPTTKHTCPKKMLFMYTVHPNK